MSTNGRNVPRRYRWSGGGGGMGLGRGDGSDSSAHWAARTDGPPLSAAGAARRKRRRQRVYGKPHHAGETRGPQVDFVSRERIFQELEGLLRQIREQAEEIGGGAADHVAEYVQTVTSFTKSIEELADPISERARSEYQRIRQKLSQALRG